MSFEFKMPQGLIDDLRKCSEIDRIAPLMLESAAPVLKRHFVRNLNAVMKDPTGELIESISTNRPNKGKNGVWHISITAKGEAKGKTYRTKGRETKKGVLKEGKTIGYRNYQKLLSLEYGDSRHKTPKPFMQKTTNDSENEVINKMQEVYNKEV